MAMDNELIGVELDNILKMKAFEKIKDLLGDTKSCLFCTGLQSGRAFATRPMFIRQVDDQGNLWFVSAEDSRKNQEIAFNNNVQLLFKGSASSDFLTLFGRAFIWKDRNKMEELWAPVLDCWFPQGIDDPNLTVIKVEVVDGYYWDSEHAIVVRFVKTNPGV
jgi:general stress protein 26